MYRYNFQYPVVVTHSDHHRGHTGNSPYLANNKEQLTQALKAIAADYNDWNTEIFDKIYQTDSFIKLCDLMEVNTGNLTFFDGSVTVISPIQIK